jgi:hypothetical protein
MSKDNVERICAYHIFLLPEIQIVISNGHVRARYILLSDNGSRNSIRNIPLTETTQL